MSGRGFIAPEEPQKCELCGSVAECRPYGLKGEEICIKCGMKDKESTEKRIREYVFGEF